MNTYCTEVDAQWLIGQLIKSKSPELQHKGQELRKRIKKEFGKIPPGFTVEIIGEEAEGN